MKKFLTLLLAGALFAAPVSARQLYIRSGGLDTHTGTTNTDGGAWKTLIPANAQAIAGDTVNVVSLDPADTTTASPTKNRIEPTHNGSSYALPIVYRSLGTTIATIPISNIDISKTFIRVQRFRSKNGTDMSHEDGLPTGLRSPNNSVIDSCIIQTDLQVCGASDTKVSNCNIAVNSGTGTRIIFGCDGPSQRNDRDTVMNNTIDLGTLSHTTRGMWFRGYYQYGYIKNNKGTAIMTLSGSGDEASAFTFYTLRSCLVEDNKWSIEVTNTFTSAIPYWIRSGCQVNTFHRDTILVSGAGSGSRSFLSTHNNPPCSDGQPLSLHPNYVCDRQCFGNTFRSCYYDVGSSSTLGFQNSFDACLMESTTVRSSNAGAPALFIESLGGSGIIRYNSFINSNGPAFMVRSLGSSSSSAISSPFDGTALIQHNFFYGKAPNSAGTSVVQIITDPDDPASSTDAFSTWVPSGTISLLDNAIYSNVSSGATRSGVQWRAMAPSNFSSQVASNNNNYGTWGQPNRAIAWMQNNNGATFSGIGASTSWNNLSMADLDGVSNCLGVSPCHGPLNITDTTYVGFDPTPTAGSVLIGTGTFGTTIGPVQYGAADVTRPAAITDLQLTNIDEEDVSLMFTTTGDDSLTGRATSYVVKIAQEEIDEAKFINPLIVQDRSFILGLPKLPGATELPTVTQLEPSTDYWIAIAVVDEVGLVSAISNVVQFRTTERDSGTEIFF